MLAPWEMLENGTPIGPYVVLSPLGEGGMGEVYLARDTRLGRTVAVKVVRRELLQDPNGRDRLEREALIIARLSHPHICTLHDIVQEDGQTYLVMEALEGSTLANRLLGSRGKRLPLAQSVSIAAEIAEALAFAHQHGIVHQDVKPANIMLTPTGAKLLDFGVARLRRAVQDHDSTVSMAHDDLARAGTLPYMSPEQLEGRGDHRADVFALGAVLHEMLTGARAFPGATAPAIIAQIVEHDPPAIAATLAAPALIRAVGKCLAKDPLARWQSTADLADELRWIGRDTVPPESPPHLGRRNRLAIAAAVVTTAAVAVLIAAGGGRQVPGPATPYSFTVEAPAGTSFSAFGHGGAPALSPDGRRLAFVAARADGTDQLWIRRLDDVSSESIPGSDGAAAPFWSPDGQQLAFFANSQMKRLALDAEVIQVMAEGIDGVGGTWNRDGVVIIATADGRMLRYNAADAAPSAIELAAGEDEKASRPSFLPDGRQFLYHWRATADRTGIYAGSLDSADRVFLVAADSGGFVSDGELLFVRGTDLLSQSFDAGTRSLSGEPRVLLRGVDQGRFTAVNGALASQTGTPWNTRLAWYDRQGRYEESLTEVGSNSDPALSPDGTRVVFTRREAASGRRDLWVLDLVRRVESRLADGLSSAAARWSPDGTRIAYSQLGAIAVPMVYDFETGTATAAAPVPSTGSRGYFVRDWSPDGRSLVTMRLGASLDLWRLHIDGRNFEALTSAGVEARVAPHGRLIAYSSIASGTSDIWLASVPLPNRAIQVSRDGGFEPTWSRDGKELYYLTPSRLLMAVSVDAADLPAVSTPRQLFELRTGDLLNSSSHYDVGLDGQRFLVVEERPSPTPSRITVMANWSTRQ